MRPNSGRIDAGGDVEVQVLLQAMKEDPPLDAKCRDKFLVQSVAVNSSATDSNVSQIWSNIEQTAKSSIQEKKIRVTFLPADSSSGAGAGAIAGAAGAAGVAGAAGAATTNGVMSHDEEPPAYSSPSPSQAAVTPQRPAASAERDFKSEPEDTTQTSTLGAAVPSSQEDLKKQLDEAKATIARLRAQAEEGLRQRKPQEAAEKAVNSVQQSMQNAPAPGGVPIQVVAGLCLLCFLIAYLFF